MSAESSSDCCVKVTNTSCQSQNESRAWQSFEAGEEPLGVELGDVDVDVQIDLVSNWVRSKMGTEQMVSKVRPCED